MHESMPPNNKDAEEMVISALFTAPQCISQIADILAAGDFYHSKYGMVYEAALSLERQGIPIDFSTVGEALEQQGKASFFDRYEISSMEHWEWLHKDVVEHATLIHQLRLLRDTLPIAQQIVADAYSHDMATISKALDALRALERGKTLTHVTTLADAVDTFINKLGTLYERSQSGIVTGVPTGFTMIDRFLGGFQPSDLITLAGRPGKGKTSLGLCILQNVAAYAVGQSYHVMMFSLEMNIEQLVRRLVSMVSQIDQSRLRTGDIARDEWNAVVDACQKLSEESVWIDDTAGISVEDMRTRAKRVQDEHGLDLIVVDYMQLMKSSNGKLAENRVQEVSAISRNLKEMARELNVPVLALAQLSRAVEQRERKIPQLSDLRESGSIEMDSDVVMFIYQDETIPSFEDGSSLVDIIIAKHRNGPIGTARLRFVPYLTQFLNLERYDLEVQR